MMSQPANSIAFHDLQPEVDNFLEDTLQGLSRPQKEIPAKYFYDQRGSELFDQICDLAEYYPTRTEIGLLHEHAAEMAALIGKHCILVEYGSGNSRKIPILLQCLQEPIAYMPIDICKEYLLYSSTQIAQYHPGLQVIAVCADYMKPFQLPACDPHKNTKKAIFFPGSTIGNCLPSEAIRLLKNAAKLVGEGGAMLVGVDLKKHIDILHAAYNDNSGITAQFNLNILARVNRELDADFDLETFSHQAFYNEQRGRIEMHLISEREQSATVGGMGFNFSKGETIHTENSYKYTVTEFQSMASVAGFDPRQVWIDGQRLFSLHYLRVH